MTTAAIRNTVQGGMPPYQLEVAPNQNANPANEAIPNVLVVDDDPIVRRQLERLYAQCGYSAIAVASAEDALRRLEHEDIDFVITDIKLPGMDGTRLISDIHHKYPGLPVIAITGYPDIQTAVDVLKLGACDFVMKPF